MVLNSILNILRKKLELLRFRVFRDITKNNSSLNMKVCVGNVYHVGYYSTIQTAEINLTPCVMKLYLVENPDTRTQIKDAAQIKTPLKQVYEIKIDTSTSVKVSYDTSGYERGGRSVTENFKLMIDGKAVHSSQFVQTYVIEFEGSAIVSQNMFVDH